MKRNTADGLFTKPSNMNKPNYEELEKGSQELGKESLQRKTMEVEKIQLEAQLNPAQKMDAIGTLAGGIAHEFNNILAAITGYTELVQLDVAEGSQAYANLNEVLEAASRAKELVKQILTFSRQSGQERKPLQVGLIVKEVLKLLRASLPSSVEIRHNIKALSTTILADPTEIHQVLVNLCANAAHAMQRTGGELRVELADLDLDADDASIYPDLKPGPYVRLTVGDTGPGMDGTVKERIFDPFFTTKEPGDGTGMGLAVVHSIVQSHGGAITVDSKEGTGTTFQVLLPQVPIEVTPKTHTPGELPAGNEQILFVDDEEALVYIGEQMLKHLGYEVVATNSSNEALAAFRTQPDKFDLVVTDQTMPKMTGEMLSKELIQIRPDVPIILCTGHSELITEESALAFGVRELVMKPLVMADLARTVRRVLDEEKEQ